MYSSEEKNTMYYLKIFLLMIIPIYGFCFTALLAFSRDVSSELKYLARGAFIARIVFLLFVGILVVFIVTTLIPMFNNFINSYGLVRIIR